MLTDIQVFQSLESALPSDVRPAVARRIRRVDALWSALHDEGFLKKAVSFAGAHPERWRPGLLGLLMASETDYLRARFAKAGSPAADVSEEILVRAEIALAESLGRDGLTLDQAALAALALSGKKDPPAAGDSAKEIPDLVAVCRYSVAPDAGKVVERLAVQLPHSARTLIDVLLSNESLDGATEILERCLKAANLESAVALCESAAAMGEPELARRLSAAAKSSPPALRRDDPEQRILRARMLRLAGESGAALPEADAARKDAKRILLDTLTESARAAEAGRSYTTALSFWQEAGALSPNAAGIRAGLARSLAGLGRPEEALAALPSSTEDPDDLLLVARIRAQTGAKEGAIDAARQSYARASGDSDPQRNFELADVLAECGDLRGAAQVMAGVGRSWPNHPGVFSRLADLHARIGDWHACAAAAASAWHLHPEDDRALRLLAQSAEHENRPAEAAAHYRLLSARMTDDPAVLLCLAQTSLAAGDPDEAHQAAERTLALQPDCGAAHAVLGLVDLARGKEENAFAELQKATRLAPTAAEPWKALAELHSAKGNREAAATTLRAGIEAASDPADLLLALGRMLIGEDRLREAVPLLERALSLHPSDTDILIALAETARGLQENAEAEEYLHRALAVAPALLPAVRQLAALLKSLGRLSEARTILERAIAADPQSPDLLMELGSLLIDIYRGTPDADDSLAAAALSVLRQAEALGGGLPDTRLQSLIGWARIFAGQLPEAVQLFGMLLQAFDGLTVEQKVDAHKGLAEAMIRSGDFPTAIHNLQAALQLSHDDSSVRRRLGEAFAASGLHEDAQAEFRKLLAERPDDVASLSAIAASLQALNRPEEAVAMLRQAAELDPSNPEIPIRLAEFLLQSGDGGQARSETARSLKLAGADDAGIALRAARILSALKEYAEAASVLENAAAENPASVVLLTEWGDALRKSGKNNRAFEIFRRAADLEPERASHLAAAADALWADGRKSASLAFLKKAVQLESNNLPLIRRLASGMTAVGLTREALPYFELAVARAPSDSALALEAAQAAFRAGDLEKAELWKESGALAASCSADGPILHAKISLEKGEIEKAVAACKQVVTSHPADARGWALLAKSLGEQAEAELRAGRPTDDPSSAAESALAKAAELSSESVEALRLTGDAAIRLQEYSTAVRCLESLCESAPDDPDAHLLLAKASILREESAYRSRLAGVTGLSAASPADGDAIRSMLGRAAALGCSEEIVEGLYARAALAFTPPDPKSIESFENLNRDNPSPDVAVAIAQAWLRAGDPERARKSAELAVNLQPEKETGRTLMGICEWKTGRPETALASLERASRSAPRAALPHALASEILAGQDRRGEAVAEMQQAVIRSKDTAAWQHRLGVWNDEAGDRSAALPCLQRAVELEPANGGYHRRFAEALMRDGDPQTALVHFRQAASFLDDKTGGLHAEIGNAAIESGRPSEAYEAFRLALDKSGPSVPFAWRLGHARAALALGLRDEARATAKAVLGGEGHPPEARIILAEIDEAEGRLPDAIRHLDHAASEMSDPVLPALRLARLWTATGSASRAAAAMQALIEANPENDEAHGLLAEALMETGRLEDALRSVQKAAELAPRKEPHWLLLGRITRRMGQLDQSLAALTKAREIAPNDVRTALECGLTYEAEQRWDLALESYQAGMKLAPETAELHYRMGVVHKNLRSYADAADELRKAVRIEPRNLAAHKLLSGVMALSLVYGVAPQGADAR